MQIYRCLKTVHQNSGHFYFIFIRVHPLDEVLNSIIIMQIPLNRIDHKQLKLRPKLLTVFRD